MLIVTCIMACKKEKSTPNSNSGSNNNTGTYSTIVHRFEITKKSNFDDFCGSSGVLHGDFIFGIDVHAETTSGWGLPFMEFTDSLKYANESNENVEKTFSYKTTEFGNFLNRIKLREADDSHSTSYFSSMSDKKIFDYVISEDYYYVPFFEYSYYPEGTINCAPTSGIITYGVIDVEDIGKEYDDTDYFISNDTLYIVTTYEI